MGSQVDCYGVEVVSEEVSYRGAPASTKLLLCISMQP